MRPRCTCLPCTLFDVHVLGSKSCSLQLYFCFVLFLSLWQRTKLWFCSVLNMDALCGFTGEGSIYGSQTCKLTQCPVVAGCRCNLLLILMEKVISGQKLPDQQVCWWLCFQLKMFRLVSLHLLQSKNKLVYPKKRNWCTAALSNIWPYPKTVKSLNSSLYTMK